MNMAYGHMYWEPRFVKVLQLLYATTRNTNIKNEIFSASNNVLSIVDLGLINSNREIGN